MLLRRLNNLCLVSCVSLCLLLVSQAANAQQDTDELNPFEVKLGGGFLSKLDAGGFGFGVAGSAQPRFFVAPKLAISARAQWAYFLVVPFDDNYYEDEVDFNSYSFLGGIHSRDRSKRASFLWGLETGAAFVRPYLGVNSSGYSEFGKVRSYWAIQPSLGFAVSRFEMEAMYHYCPSTYGRYFTLNFGVRLGGGYKK